METQERRKGSTKDVSKFQWFQVTGMQVLQLKPET
jgi:hypothetical protein